MALERDIEEIRAGFKTGRFGSEAAVSQGIVLRLLSALGWPIHDTQAIIPQFVLGGRRVDYALCHPPGKPIAFIEVKNVGQGGGAERQLFEYAFHEGIQLAILTDGRGWGFFLPAEQGDYAERRVYKLDIVESDLSECTHRLNRYLKYDVILTGDAIAAARKDYGDVSRERQIKAALPQAWEQLVENEDELLLELVVDRVESLCGYKPDFNTVASFLKENVAALAKIPPSQQKSPQLEAPRSTMSAPSEEWRNPAASDDQVEGEKAGSARRRDLGRLPHGRSTPQKVFRKPILQVLIDMGGQGNAPEVVERVGQVMKPELRDVDYQLLSIAGVPRWQRNVHWARYHMVRDGLLKSRSPRGVWEISEKGRAFLGS